MKKFYITTLGCKVNQYESDGIAKELVSGGWTRETDYTGADICIINTCTVTSKAAMQSRQAIRAIIRANPDTEIIVTGCHAQTAPDEIKKINGVNYIAGHKDKFKIANAILSSGKGHKSQAQDNEHNGNKRKKTALDSLNFPESNECTDRIFHSFAPAVTGNMTRAYLKIQDGCNAFCTYCIVPHARGRSCSMPENQVIEHLNRLKKQGYPEAVITGIHAGMYGLDLKEKSSLATLLKKIDALKPIHRVRLSSIEPKELNDDIIGLAAKSSTFCDHFHIPLQSGDDEILNRMKRPYDSALFRNLILRINRLMPFAAIGVDLLLGFPGESEKAFQNTCCLIKDLPVSYLHVFPFSPRKGTPAFDYSHKVRPEIIKHRCAVIRQLGLEKKKQFIKKNIGRTIEAVVLNKRDSSTGMLKAVTSNYLTIFVNGEDRLKRKIINVMPLKVMPQGADSNNIVYGEIV